MITSHHPSIGFGVGVVAHFLGLLMADFVGNFLADGLSVFTAESTVLVGHLVTLGNQDIAALLLWDLVALLAAIGRLAVLLVMSGAFGFLLLHTFVLV